MVAVISTVAGPAGGLDAKGPPVMRRTLVSILPIMLATSVVIGCQNFPLVGGSNGTTFNQLAFSPISEANKALLGARGEAAGGMAAPQAADARIAAPAMMPAPDMHVPVGYWPGGDYDLAESSEAKAPGFSGTFSEVLDKHIRPLVQGWAGDASLRAAGGYADDKGVNPATGDSVRPYADGWRFTYFSPVKMESLSFLVNGNQTLVLKQRFKSREQDIQSPALGSTEVITIVTKAITDRNAVANDPEMGKGGGSVGIAVPGIAVNPTVAVDAPPPPMDAGNASSAGSATAPAMPIHHAPQEEIIYEVPAGAKWDLNLYREPNRLVWNVSLMVEMPETAVSSDGKRTGYGGGWARVDANSGALLSLERPRKYTFVEGVGGPEPRPMPHPAAQTEPAPAK